MEYGAVPGVWAPTVCPSFFPCSLLSVLFRFVGFHLFGTDVGVVLDAASPSCFSLLGSAPVVGMASFMMLGSSTDVGVVPDA
eukprot:10033572-Prorocentrum_lima.AAC.1